MRRTLAMQESITADLKNEAHRLGFEVRRDGDRLLVKGPRSEEWFLLKLAESKPEILEALDRPHAIFLRVEPYPNELDFADPVDGQRIIEAVQAHGGTLAIERRSIVLRWTGHMPDVVSIIDQIRANRTGVVVALETACAGRRRIK